MELLKEILQKLKCVHMELIFHEKVNENVFLLKVAFTKLYYEKECL